MASYRIERRDGQYVVRVTGEDGRVNWSPPCQTKARAELWIVQQDTAKMGVTQATEDVTSKTFRSGR
jgi:hypothetical protein